MCRLGKLASSANFKSRIFREVGKFAVFKIQKFFKGVGIPPPPLDAKRGTRPLDTLDNLMQLVKLMRFATDLATALRYLSLPDFS